MPWEHSIVLRVGNLVGRDDGWLLYLLTNSIRIGPVIENGLESYATSYTAKKETFAQRAKRTNDNTKLARHAGWPNDSQTGC